MGLFRKKLKDGVPATALVVGVSGAPDGHGSARCQLNLVIERPGVQRYPVEISPIVVNGQPVSGAEADSIRSMIGQAMGGPAGDPRLAALQQLASLRDSGVLTEAEFEAQKARILGG